MNSIYTAEQVRAFEENSFIKEGDDLRAMMEAAKQSVEILNKDFSTSEFLILCGPGNNGGDGYFIGIGLSELKKRVKFLDVLDHIKKSPLCEHAFKAAKDSDFIFTCVGNDNDLREVTLGKDGLFHSINKGSVYIDNTTASAKLAAELSKTAMNQGIGFLDAPVSGGQAGAENGVLTVMVGGEQKVFDSAETIIDSYALKVELMSGFGCGQLTKMVNQICVAGFVQGLSEGLDFARAAGLDPKQVAQVISKGAAQSWQMVNRYETMIEGKFNYGFAVANTGKNFIVLFIYIGKLFFKRSHFS